MVVHKLVDDAVDVFRGNEPGAFELPVGIFLPRTPGEVLVFKFDGAVGPAAVAHMIVDDPVGGVKFGQRQTETADQDHGPAHRPGQPGQAAGEADEKVGVIEQIHPLAEGQIAGKILGAVGDGVPAAAAPVAVFPVDAQDPVAFGFKVLDRIHPAGGVIPVLGLAGGLGGDTDIGFRDASFRVARRNLRPYFLRPEAQDIGDGFLQAGDAPVDRLMHPVVAGKEDTHVVGGVDAGGPFVGADEAQFRIGRLKQLRQFGRHGAVNFAVMQVFKDLRVREPGDDVAQGADGKFEENFFAGRIKVVAEYEFVLPVDFQTEVDIVLFGAGDKHIGCFGVVEGIERVAVCDFDAPVAGGHFDPRAVIEVEVQSFDVGLAGKRAGIAYEVLLFHHRRACRFRLRLVLRFMHPCFLYLLY